MFPSGPSDEGLLSAEDAPSPGTKSPPLLKAERMRTKGQWQCGEGTATGCLSLSSLSTSVARTAKLGMVLELKVGEGSTHSRGWPFPVDLSLTLSVGALKRCLSS